MGKVIPITIKEKIATAPPDVVYICGNSDFSIEFDFDSEWNEFSTKTARLEYNGQYIDVVFQGDICDVPIISNTNKIMVGVFAGNLHTTTPALVVARKSILCGSGSPTDPPADVYNQIMDMLNRISGAKPATTENLGTIIVGDNLQITKEGVLSVVTTNEAEQDNTKPITSAGVHTQVGNIEVLLAAL